MTLRDRVRRWFSDAHRIKRRIDGLHRAAEMLAVELRQDALIVVTARPGRVPGQTYSHVQITCSDPDRFVNTFSGERPDD